MNWLETHKLASVSACGTYAMRGAFLDSGFAWRARVIATDVLVASSWDRGYVDSCVDRHAANGVQP